MEILFAQHSCCRASEQIQKERINKNDSARSPQLQLVGFLSLSLSLSLSLFRDDDDDDDDELNSEWVYRCGRRDADTDSAPHRRSWSIMLFEERDREQRVEDEGAEGAEGSFEHLAPLSNGALEKMCLNFASHSCLSGCLACKLFCVLVRASERARVCVCRLVCEFFAHTFSSYSPKRI